LTGFDFTFEESEAIHQAYIDVCFDGDREAYEEHNAEIERQKAKILIIGTCVICSIPFVFLATMWLLYLL